MALKRALAEKLTIAKNDAKLIRITVRRLVGERVREIGRTDEKVSATFK
jgi:hypothetical protein